jgi:hypothetical protein
MNCPKFGRAMIPRCLTLLALALAAGPALAAEVQGLYRAEALVTGTEEPERTRGFRIGLTEVIAKLTGRADLAPHPALTRALQRPHGFVAAFDYEDRMKDIPVHDEQGTRERPHFLRMSFDPARMDALVAAMGLTKWSAERPRLAVLLTVRDARRVYLLTSDGEHGYGQREVLKSASARAGLPILIPSESALGASGLTPEALTTQDALAATQALGADGLLLGQLWLDKDGAYWDVIWQIDCQGVTARWTLDNVSFDQGLRDAVRRAALALSSKR